MMWDEAQPDEEDNILANIGCSDAVAREAAPSSASGNRTDIVQRMARKPVNLQQVPSAMGRGPIQDDDGESAHRLEDIAQMMDDRRVTDTYSTNKTSNVKRPV